MFETKTRVFKEYEFMKIDEYLNKFFSNSDYDAKQILGYVATDNCVVITLGFYDYTKQP
jgi:hypothetical protein